MRPPTSSIAIREPPTASYSAGAAPIRPRAFWIGAVLVALPGMFQPYVALVLRSYYSGLGSLPAAPVVALLLLLALGGWAARRLGPRCALAPAELLLIYMMLLVSAQLPHGAGLPYILSATVYPFYFGVGERLFHEAIPAFLRLNHDVANEGFYRGRLNEQDDIIALCRERVAALAEAERLQEALDRVQNCLRGVGVAQGLLDGRTSLP